MTLLAPSDVGTITRDRVRTFAGRMSTDATARDVPRWRGRADTDTARTRRTPAARSALGLGDQLAPPALVLAEQPLDLQDALAVGHVVEPGKLLAQAGLGGLDPVGE